MKNKKSKKINIKQIILNTILILIITISMLFIGNPVKQRVVIADSGFSTSHSSGGSSHRSSSSSHRSSSSSSSHRGSTSSSTSGSGDPITALVAFGIYIMLIIIITSITKKSKKNMFNEGIPNVNDSNIEEKVKKYIPDFNKVEFLNNGYKMYCDIQTAWMNFKLDDVKDYLTDELYTMYDSQLETLEVKDEQNIMKDFTLRTSFLKNVTEQNGTVTITTGYVIEFYDYIASKSTGKLIRGNNKQKMRVMYEMKFRLSINENAKIDTCPNCGAKVDVNSSGTCEYCGSKIVADNTKWVLTEKNSLSQRYI